MDMTPTGYAPKPGLLQELMLQNPQFQGRDSPPGTTSASVYGRQTSYNIIEYTPLLDSAVMGHKDWVRIATDIDRYYNDYDGFLVLHGTDTMAYTASALSFMLQDLAKPVVLTGAQIPLAEQRTDSLENLVGSFHLLGHFTIPEVAVFFGGKLLRGNRCWKQNSFMCDAFVSDNYSPLATIGVNVDVRWDLVRAGSNAPNLRLISAMCPDVAVLHLHPSITASVIEAVLAPPIKGAIVLTFGTGNGPEDEERICVFRRASLRGVVLVNVSQCRSGGVKSGAYTAGSALAAAGLVSGMDMTLEAALTKLMWLLPQHKPQTVRKLMSTSIMGELKGILEKSDTSFDNVRFLDGLIQAVGHSSERAKYAVEKVLHPVLLCSAASIGSIETLGQLIEQKGDVNAADYDLRTPLHLSAAEGHLEVSKFLVEMRANVNVEDRWGGSPIGEAARCKHASVVAYLRKSGASLLNHKTGSWKLFTLVKEQNYEDVELWLMAGADPNVVDVGLRTPLMDAAARGSLAMCAALLEADADPYACDRWGRSAFDESKPHEQVWKFLQLMR